MVRQADKISLKPGNTCWRCAAVSTTWPLQWSASAAIRSFGTHLARPRLKMRDFSDAFLDAYLAVADELVLSSVGCYQLEGLGVHLFAEIHGEHAAILGLPLLPLLGFLRQHGIVASLALGSYSGPWTSTCPAPCTTWAVSLAFCASGSIPSRMPCRAFDKQVDVVRQILGRKRIMSVDELRRGIEALPEADYHRLSYYERWLRSIVSILLEKGVLTEAELEAALEQT